MTSSEFLPLRPRRVEVRHETMVVEGHALEEVVLGGHVLGAPLGTAPVAIVVGGITASPFPFGDPESGAEAWWPALAGPDLLDLDRTTVLCPCWPGNGSTWRGFEEGEIPPLSALGLADLIAAWLDGIGCVTPATYIGASLGGLVGLAFAVRHAERCARLVTISAGLAPGSWGTAARRLQRELVRDGQRRGDVATGMARAHQLALLTHRALDGVDLDEHGHRFATRFPVRTFLVLGEVLDRSRFGADPAAVRAQLARITADVLVVGVPGDLLFPYELQRELYGELLAAGASGSLWELDSEHGHDAYLADQDRLARLLREAGAFASAAPRPRLA